MLRAVLGVPEKYGRTVKSELYANYVAESCCHFLQAIFEDGSFFFLCRLKSGLL
jgi:hypothetical protein